MTHTNGTVYQYARAWGMTWQTLNNIAEKRTDLRYDTAEFISAQTKGAVSIAELRCYKPRGVIHTAPAPVIAPVSQAPLRGRRAPAVVPTPPPVPAAAEPVAVRRRRRTRRNGASSQAVA